MYYKNTCFEIYICVYCLLNWVFVNPISAGVLENQDMLGGGSIWPPPSKSHVWCPNMTNDTSLEICKFVKIEFFIAKSSYVVKMFAKKKLSKK